MDVIANSPALFKILDPAGTFKRLAGGFEFAEGPIWNPTEERLYFSDVIGNVRRCWSEREGVTNVMFPSNKGNGMTFDGHLNLLVCEHETSSVIRESCNGGRAAVATHFRGKELNSPNDVCVRSDGSIYFSDPVYGRLRYFGVRRKQELDIQGVYLISPSGELELAASDFTQPNGLCFSPDETLLYINDTARAHIRAFSVGADGRLRHGRIFAEGIGNGDFQEGVVDGMKCDNEGNIWVTGPDGIWIFSPNGDHLGVVKIPENVANMHWGGREWSDLYVCASTSLYLVRTKVSGNHEPFMRVRHQTNEL